MPRKTGQVTESRPTIVFKFRAYPPVAGVEEMEAQFHARHVYANALVELQRMKNEASSEWLQRISPELLKATQQLAAVEEKIDRLYDRLGDLRKAHRARVKLPPEMAEELKQLKAERKAASIACGTAKTQLRHQLSPDLAHLEPEYQERTKGLRGKKLKEALAQDEELQQLSKQVIAARKIANRDLYGEIGAAQLTLHKRLRKASSVYWGTYLQVDAAAEQSAKTGVNPEFKPWTGEGKLSLQLQGGKSKQPVFVAEAYACESKWLRLERVVQPAAGPNGQSPSVKKPRYHLWMRIGSSGRGNRDPIWCVIPFRVHRQLPRDARISGVHLQRVKIGESVRFYVLFELQRAEGWRKPTAASGRVAVDVGYRQVKEGLRVAFWRDEEGHKGQLVIPSGPESPMMRRRIRLPRSQWRTENGRTIKHRIVHFPADRLKQREHAAHLQSIRSKNFDTMREQLAAWLDRGALEIPEWLNQAIRKQAWKPKSTVAPYITAWIEQHPKEGWLRSFLTGWLERVMTPPAKATEGVGRVTLRHWRSSARLRRLVEQWRDARFAGDEDIFAELTAWRKQDKHLLQWQEHERQAFLDWRKTYYRTFAAELRKQYAKVVIENIDLREFHKKPKPEQDAKAGSLTHNLSAAALAELFEAIKQSGMEVELRDPAYTTMRCADCEHVNQWDETTRARQFLTCESCARTYDQDDMACRNLLAPPAEAVASVEGDD